MFRPLALYIGLRYTRAKKRNHFISFISFSSMIGIALGVAVLITVLSVMNGFDEEISERVFGMAPHITISNMEGKLSDWNKLDKQSEKFPGVVGTAPFVSGVGLLSYSGQVGHSFLSGILPERQTGVSDISKKMVAGKLSDLQAGQFGIVLGETLALNLGLKLGDKVTVMIPQATVTPVGLNPRFKRFNVVGIFNVGQGFEFDKRLAFIHMNDAQKLFQMGDAISGLRLKVTDLYAAPELAVKLANKLPAGLYVSNWTLQFGAFFKALQMEKTMMFIILLLIIAVAVFNLVSSLVMVVTDKQSDIAILRTLGATPKTIMAIFMVQGSVIGITGTLLGLIGGLILSNNVTAIVSGLQSLLQVQLISSSVYFIDYLPSKILSSDLEKICSAALIMSLLATLYPAWRASRVQAAEALRYE